MKKQKNQSGLAHVIVLITIMLGIICAVTYVFYRNYSQNQESNTSSEADTKSTKALDYILVSRTSLADLCQSDDCNKILGKIKLENTDLIFSANLSDINTYKTRGIITLGDNSIDVRSMDLNKNSFNYSKIEAFEVYGDKYLIVYLRTDDRIDEYSGRPYHGYRIQIYDKNWEKISGLDGYTCGGFDSFKIHDNILTYNAFSSVAPVGYDAAKNIHNFNMYNVTANIPMDALLAKDYSKSEKLDINYDCGTSQ